MTHPVALSVIPTYLARESDVDVLETTVRTLRGTAFDSTEILIVDDCSPLEGTIDHLDRIAEKYGCDIHVKEENTGFCSPPDEPILTARHGYVPLGDLRPEQGLVSFSNQSSQILAARDFFGGYAFERVSRPYCGEMLCIETLAGVARVTPNHGVPARWTDRATVGWAVYLMQKGSRWRVGQTQMIAHGGVVGVRQRMKNQGADCAWVLSIHDTRESALVAEQRIAWTYGVPALQFRTAGERGISQSHLEEIWAGLETTAAAHQILFDHGRHPDWPMYSRVMGRKKRNAIHAINLMPGHMDLYACGDMGERGGVETRRVEFAVDRYAYEGTVMSLDVLPHHHYISNGVVVHNSKTVNIGLQRALDEERDAVLVNADLEFRAPGWVQKMRETRNLHLKEGYAWVVGALLSYPNGLVQHGGVYFSLLVRAFDHLWKYAPENLSNVSEYRMCPVTGALQFIRHECLATVGLYDEGFSMAFEDVDYCLRVFIDHKQECVFNPHVRAFHHESLFRGRGDEKVNQWTRESLALLMEKWKDQSMAGLVPTW